MTRAIYYLAITARENNPLSFIKEAFFDTETINAFKTSRSAIREKKENVIIIADLDPVVGCIGARI